MIAFADGLPLVRFADGEVLSFRQEWLVRELREAAKRSGHNQWWLAEHVAQSVTQFLVDHAVEPVIDLARLTLAVRQVLQVIGFGEIVPHFDPAPPPVQISLVDLARTAGTGYELAFFDLLGQRLQACVTAPSNEFQLYGLERCVKHLCVKKIWCRECDELRVEIVSFVREQIDATASGRPIAISLV